MTPKSFTGQNVVYAKDQPEYLPLPAHKSDDGCVTTCWRLTLLGRFRVLLTGEIWLQTLTFNAPLQPQRMCNRKPEGV